MKILAWRVWYDGDRYFDSTSTSFADLPGDGWLYGVLYTDTPISAPGAGRNYRILLAGFTSYGVNLDTALYATNEDALDENKRRYPSIPEKHWKRGRSVPDDEYAAVQTTGFDTKSPPR